MHCKCHHSCFLKWSVKNRFFPRIPLVEDPALIFCLKEKKRDENFTLHRGKKKILFQNVEAAKVSFSVWFSSRSQRRTAIFHRQLSLLISNKCTKDENLKSYTSNGFYLNILKDSNMSSVCSASVKPFTGMQTRRKVLKCL